MMKKIREAAAVRWKSCSFDMSTKKKTVKIFSPRVINENKHAFSCSVFCLTASENPK